MRRVLPVVGRAALVLIPLALGVALLLRAVSEREPPPMRVHEEAASAVRVITMMPTPFVPAVSTFGSVEPARTWHAVAQVAGEVAWLYPQLREGRLIEAGTEIIRLDAVDYELAEAQAEARLAGADARLAELATREDNLGTSAAIERRGLALAETDLERYRRLLERGTTSQVVVDQAESALLQRRARVQEIDNELRLIPTQRRVQEAERAIAQSQLAEARRNIERTRIRMPFDGRIAEQNIERDQFVTVGQTLVIAEDIASAEVTARLRLDQLESLMTDRLEIVSVMDFSASDFDDVARELNLSAQLRLDIGGRTVSWPAEVRRISFALEPATRTIGLVVGVDDPFRQAIPGERPPLVRDMFVEIVVSGPARDNALLLPREALERDADGGWFVHVADVGNRLRTQAVGVDNLFGNTALINDGLSPGDRVVVSELPVAIDGMLLAPREDDALGNRLRAAGTGTGTGTEQ